MAYKSKDEQKIDVLAVDQESESNWSFEITSQFDIKSTRGYFWKDDLPTPVTSLKMRRVTVRLKKKTINLRWVLELSFSQSKLNRLKDCDWVHRRSTCSLCSERGASEHKCISLRSIRNLADFFQVKVVQYRHSHRHQTQYVKGIRNTVHT